MEINQYPLESLTFQDNDYYDIDFWTGSGYQTKKILGSTIKAGILAAVENIYNADGSLNGNRTIDLDGNVLSFESENGGELYSFISDSTTSKSTFNQTIGQIYFEINDLTAGKNASFNVDTIDTQLVLNDGAGNLASLQISGVGSALNFTDGITNYRVEANENGVIINTSYILPNTDGTAGQVMTTNGAGVVSWQDSATTIISWGDIVGTLSDQTDLQAALDAKLNDPEGVASQYIRGDGTLADFPTLTGGGSAVSLYLNGGVSQGTILGGQYYQLSNIANLGPSADFNLNADGLIAQFITDVNEPNVINIPAGNWHTEFYFSASSGGGTPNFYVEIYKYDGTAFTLLGSNSANPENIVGSAVDLYYTAIAIPETTLTPTDRIAIRVFVSHAGRTITLHTQDNNLSEVITTISTGLTALNGLTDQIQYFQTGSSGTNFNISSSGDTHTFNIPTADATNTGLLSSTDWSTFNNKVDDNVYTADGTLTGTRIVNMDIHDLTFSSSNDSNQYDILFSDGTKQAQSAISIGSINNYVKNALGDFISNTNIPTSTTTLVANSAITIFSEAINTQNSFTKRVVNGATTRIMELSTLGLRINNEYYLPNTDGTSGQVVTTDGAGNLSFTTISTSTPFIPPVESTEIRRGVIPLSGTTTLGTFGALSPIQTGSAVAVTFGGITKLPKLRLLTTTSSTNSVVGIAFGSSGQVNTLDFGFRFIGTYIYSDQSAGGTNWFVPNARQFCGLAGSTSLLLPISSTITLESQINIIGIGSDATDTNLQIFHNDNTGTATKIDLGVNFPANKTGAVANGEAYQLELYAPYGATSVKYRVTKLSDNTIVTGTITTNLPSSTTPLAPQVVRTSGSTSQNVSIDVIQLTASTLY